MEQALNSTSRVFEMITGLPYVTTVAFRHNEMYPQIIYRGEDPIFCTYFGEVMSYDIHYNGDIANIKPLEFNAVLGFGNVQGILLYVCFITVLHSLVCLTVFR